MSLEEWTKAFIEAQGELPPISKSLTADAGSYSYSYAGLTEISEVALPILHNHGLGVAQDVVSEGERIGVITRILHMSGHIETFGPLLLAAGSTPQSAGSAITYARRYGLSAALGLTTEDDDDGARTEPIREDIEPVPGDWLGDAVQIFKGWSEDERRDHYTNAMKGLAMEEMTTIQDAHRIFDFMKGLYLEEYPGDDQSPF